MEYKKIQEIDLAYIAGLFDGEGSISIIKNNNVKDRITPGFTLVVALANNDFEAHQFLLEKFGGSVNSSNRWYRTYQWKLLANEASKFLTLILPYLKLKKKRAIIGIQFQIEKVRFNQNRYPKQKFEGGIPIPEKEVMRREELRQQLHELNFKNRRYIPLS
jgi:hypothetical protein